MVPHTIILSPAESFYEYHDAVEFKCVTGYTITGQAGGAETFSVACEKTGRFATPSSNCMPISCGEAPPKPHSQRSSTHAVTYGTVVTYACNDGFTVGHGEVVFTASCGSDR